MKAISNTLSELPVSAALAVDLRAKERQAAGMDVISFCVGEPDFAAPAAACLAGVQAIESGDTKYTNAVGTAALRAAFADALMRDCGVSYAPSDIAVTTGAKFAVYATVLALVNPGDEIILPAPYWTSYRQIIRLSGAVPVIVPCKIENGWKLTPAQLSRACTSETKALILNNPNNPTGAVYSRSELTALARVACEQDLYVIADEIYRHLLYTDEPFCSMASVGPDAFARTITISGVSKAYAMTGWRIGCAAGSTEIIRAVAALLSHTTGSPNTIAQAAAEAALHGSLDETESMRQTFLRRRDCLIDALKTVPSVRCIVPQGAFYVMLDVRGLPGVALRGESDFALRLLDAEGVAAVPCTDFGAPGFLRLSYTLDEARILEGILRLKRFIERDETHVTAES